MRALVCLATGLLLASCGGISSKHDAVKAVVLLGITGNLVAAQNSPTVIGQEGSARVVRDGSTLKISYLGYSANGVDAFDGEISQRVEQQSSSSVVQLRGSVTMEGSYDAALDVDVTEWLTANTATRSTIVRLKGDVVADGQAFSFDNESFEIAYDE